MSQLQILAHYSAWNSSQTQDVQQHSTSNNTRGSLRPVKQPHWSGQVTNNMIETFKAVSDFLAFSVLILMNNNQRSEISQNTKISEASEHFSLVCYLSAFTTLAATFPFEVLL